MSDIIEQNIRNKDIKDYQFAWELYCSLCNQVWIDKDYNFEEFRKWDSVRYTEIDDDTHWQQFPRVLNYSWRASGGLISRNCYKFKDDYLEFYCCAGSGGIGEGMITERAKELWEELGYKLFENYYDKNN